MQAKTKIAVAGATGRVGRHIVESCASAGTRWSRSRAATAST